MDGKVGFLPLNTKGEVAAKVGHTGHSWIMGAWFISSAVAAGQ